MKRLSARHGTTVLSVPTEGKKEASEDNRNWDGRTEEREGTDFFERRSGGNGEARRKEPWSRPRAISIVKTSRKKNPSGNKGEEGRGLAEEALVG